MVSGLSCRAWATTLARVGSARPDYLTASSKVCPDDVTTGSIVIVHCAWAATLAQAGSARPDYLTVSLKVCPDDATAGSIVNMHEVHHRVGRERRQQGGEPLGRWSHRGRH